MMMMVYSIYYSSIYIYIYVCVCVCVVVVVVVFTPSPEDSSALLFCCFHLIITDG